MSATTSRSTASGRVSARAIATLPPMEWPSTAAGAAPSAASVSATSPAIAG
jgi:hypothetical protein